MLGNTVLKINPETSNTLPCRGLSELLATGESLLELSVDKAELAFSEGASRGTVSVKRLRPPLS